MLAPGNYTYDDIVTMDRAYVHYAKFEELTDKDMVSASVEM